MEIAQNRWWRDKKQYHVCLSALWTRRLACLVFKTTSVTFARRDGNANIEFRVGFCHLQLWMKVMSRRPDGRIRWFIWRGYYEGRWSLSSSRGVMFVTDFPRNLLFWELHQKVISRWIRGHPTNRKSWPNVGLILGQRLTGELYR